MDQSRLCLLLSLVVVCVILGFNNCGHRGTNSQYLPTVQITSNASPLSIVGNEAYVLSVSLGCGYVNEPCVTVQVCQPGTNKCVNVNNVLLDTGSYGLRVFSSVINSLSLNQEIDSAGHSIAECQSYADGSSDWGPVARADVLMNGETASNIPIQIINAQFATAPSDCTGIDQNASAAGFNGILGVGQLIQDCGDSCVNGSNNRIYFDCAPGATNCDSNSISVSLKNQVMNPAAALSHDNNGVVVQMPAISPYGATGVNGWLIFGIGTQSDNIPPAGVVTFPADSYGDFETNFNSKNYRAFIDSGSNGLYFPAPSGLTVCSDAPGFYCPSSAYISSATQSGTSGTPSQSIQFEIQDADIALASSNPNVAFNNLGGPFTSDFDWGMPFFFGRTIYIGFEKSNTPIGTGPYWAY